MVLLNHMVSLLLLPFFDSFFLFFWLATQIFLYLFDKTIAPISNHFSFEILGPGEYTVL